VGASSLLEAVASESRAAHDGYVAELSERVVGTAKAKIAEEPATFDAEEYVACRHVWLTGATSDTASLWCRDVDLLVQSLDCDCLCWDGSGPSVDGVVAEYVSSYTAVIERALRLHPNLVACAFVEDLALARPWLEVAKTFAGRVRFFRTGRTGGPKMEDVVALGLAPEMDPRAQVYTVYPADGDEWGGMALTTPCRISAQKVEALNEAWMMQWQEEEWRLC